MATPHLLLSVPLGLLFACGLTAQRGHHGGGGGHGGGSIGGGHSGHSGGSFGGGGHAAPVAHPRVSAPAPAPHFSNPTPHFSNPTPRGGNPTPHFSNPVPIRQTMPTQGVPHTNPGIGAPRQSMPTPGAAPRQQPGVNYRAPGNIGSPAPVSPGGSVVTRPTLTPRVTTRSDVRSSPGIPHYQPSPTVRTPAAGAAPGGGTIHRPMPNANARATTPVPTAGINRPTTNIAPNRYQPTLRTPTAAGAVPGSTHTGAHLTPRSTANPAPTMVPRGTTAVGVPRHGGAPSAAPGLPRAGSGRLAAPVSTHAVGPHLNPRAAAPRLGFPRSSNVAGGNRIVQPIAHTYGAPRYTWGRSHCNTGSIWNTWWRPWGYGGFGYTNYSYGGWGYGYGPYGYYGGFGGLSYYSGCGSFGFGVSLWQPWWTWRNYYWNSCYGSAWWNTWSRPYYVSSGYWWYPTTTYLPTYLYVPNTVYVPPTTVNVPTTVVYASDGGSVAPTVAAGGSVVGTARGGSLPVDAGGDDMAAALAVKYVDLGDFYFRAGRFDDAVEAYGKARSYAPNDASVHFVLADASFAHGDYHYAAFLIAEAIRLDPSIASAKTDKRTFYGDVKVFDAQMAALDSYLAKQPYDAMAHLVRGYNLRFSGQDAEAQKAFDRVLEIDPEHRAAKAFLAAMAATSR